LSRLFRAFPILSGHQGCHPTPHLGTEEEQDREPANGNDGKQKANNVVTPASGDQGADVFAEKGDQRVVIQAKFHRAPVGNKAVQEAHSAKAHYRATAAVVVGNSRFTPSAQQLAQSTGVSLLHHMDLPQLSSLLNEAHQPKAVTPMDERISLAP
jgi:restriction endonuclease Mrr